MRDYPEDKQPWLLIVAKDSDELEEAWYLWAKIVIKLYKGRAFEEEPICFGITERNVRYNMENNLPFGGYTDFLISHDIHDCMLIDYLCKNIGG